MTVDGVDCPINGAKRNDDTRITCTTGPKPTATDPSLYGEQPGSPGMIRTIFDSESRHILYYRDEWDSSWVRPGREHIEDVELRTSFETEINELNNKPNRGVLMDGWFKAPDSGEYRFYMACDDHCRLWLDQNPFDENDPQPPQPTLIA